MKNVAIFLSVLVLSIMIYSCKKEKNAESTTYPNYVRFNAGSYWIYRQFVVDSSGNATPTNYYDSCFVEKDTLINGQTFFKYYRPVPYNTPYESGYMYLRDSLHYIVGPNGFILFSSQDFQTIFDSHYYIIPDSPNDTMCHVITKMEDKNVPVSTPAGTFITSDYRKTYTMYPKWAIAGNPRYIHTRYAVNIGIVTETFPFFTADPNYIERRLLRYHIN
jgi:hypothetical protein